MLTVVVVYLYRLAYFKRTRPQTRGAWLCVFYGSWYYWGRVETGPFFVRGRPVDSGRGGGGLQFFFKNPHPPPPLPESTGRPLTKKGPVSTIPQ